MQLNVNYMDFARELAALTRPEAFPRLPPGERTVTVTHTHASAVLLTGDRAYKLKKPNNFGFFDYSTPALRRHFCGEEVRLNSRLAPHVYLGVSPVLLDAGGGVTFGPALSPDELPEPGITFEGAMVIDYAVVMVRLPDDAMLETLVRRNAVSDEVIREVARRVATFHAAVPTSERIASFGRLELIRANWDENFAQMEPYIGRALDSDEFSAIRDYVYEFMSAHERLFEARIRDGRIRDCHGDLRLQHVYVLDRAHKEPDAVAIVDCIEFNERFRYSDVAAEIAFLTMELEMAGRADLSRAFTAAYADLAHDHALRELLPFYACYRACVRGKVLSFQLDEHEVPPEQREAARAFAQRHFALAAHYAQGPRQPLLIMVGGVMGTGKSTVAESLHHELGGTLVSTDAIRKRLAGRAATDLSADAFGTGLYSAEWTERTYEATLAAAHASLADGHTTVIDASFGRAEHRRRASQIAADAGARAIFVECICPRDLALTRLAERWQSRGRAGAHLASVASDGRPELYDEQRRHWEPLRSNEEARLHHIMLPTDMPLCVTLEHALEALGVPRLACWLSA
jgi:aminoglycoside phosphotransferase family enzyme/predicted kinase